MVMKYRLDLDMGKLHTFADNLYFSQTKQLHVLFI